MKRMQFVLIACLCLMTVAVAQEPTPPQTEGQRGQRAARGMDSVQEKVRMLSDKLNLTVDQVAKIKPILEDQGRQLVTVMKDGSTRCQRKCPTRYGAPRPAGRTIRLIPIRSSSSLVC